MIHIQCNRILLSGTLATLCLGFIACGNEGAVTATFKASANTDPMIAIPLSVGNGRGGKDVRVQDFLVEVTDCLSGFHVDIAKSKGVTVLPLLENDRNCVARLREIKRKGKRYQMPAGTMFNPEEGAVNILVSVKGDELPVAVERQLSPVITVGQEVVAFTILAHDKGKDTKVRYKTDGDSCKNNQKRKKPCK